ncbi:MAG: Gfo/Idh/MocA family oxidoreductase [Anaerolineae bacterium]|nr:Gfo/Idh/MocA family oxidoreductase [Anaerolineae bacterium]
MQSLSFAIIGAGNIAKVHAQAIRAIPGAQVRVVCSRREEMGRALSDLYGAAWLPDYREAVARDDVDVVCICTPSATHADIAEAAAQAGKHLVIEKPIDVTLERADRIIRAVQRPGLKMTCVFPSRFTAGVRKAKEAVEQGRLGRLALADAYVKWYRPQSYYDGSWRGTWAGDGGGALINQSIHSIDLLQWLAGPVESVFGHTATLAHRMETEDTASVVLVFRNGALGVIQGATSCWPGDRARIELHGEKGTIFLEEGRVAKWKLAGAAPDEEARMLALEETGGSGSADPMGIGYELHRRQIADLVDAIREDRPPAIGGAEARKALEIILAIYRSAQTGAVVKLPLTQVL